MQNASVSLPRRGRRPAASASFSAQAPHSSLPWISAVSSTWRPGRPASKCQTPGVAPLPTRSASSLGQASSNGRTAATAGGGDMATPESGSNCIGVTTTAR
ncbi:Uncharacterised protein [Bordetella pertussis]|nr:Uncharacterised protein [Bordetella pertussis]